MKNLVFYLLTLLSCICISCSKESVDIGQLNTGNPIIPDQPENIITTPCGFDLSGVAENDTIIIDCLLDLGGATINLPANITFEFKGGDIINGTLIFSGGMIDGRLLSNKLAIGGDVQLIGDTFRLYAVRWDIVEGETTSAIALKNNAEFERIMFFTKALGATIFEIGRLDAYFEITKVTSTTTNQNFYPTLEAVNIPSDFHLKMSDDTHLRTFTAEAGVEGGTVLAVDNASNIIVSGGTIYGDRDKRIYSAADIGLEGTHLFTIRSGKNITLDGIKFVDGSKGSMNINSYGFSFNPDYNPTTGVVIKNCEFINSRRMALALTDARDVLIEGNTFIDSGQPSTNSDGGEVGYAINIEPDRFRDDNGVLFERQKAFDITIRGNTETGSRGGFVTATIGQDITIENNTIGTRAVYSLVSGTKIINNTFKATGTATESWAIFAAGGIESETVFNNEIANNTIEGYSLGIATGTKDTSIHDNTITNCKQGIQIGKTIDSRVYNNTITVSNNGIGATNTFNNNVEVTGNTVTSGGFHVYFVQLNNTEEHKNNTMVVENNTFSNFNQVVISGTKGITFKNNTLTGGIEVGNASNIDVSFNTVTPNESDGIRLFGSHTSVAIANNEVSEPTGASRYVCINNDSDSPAGITMTNNTCN